MLNKHIFKANRGEGKTRWLVDRALEAEDAGLKVIYLGSFDRYDHFRRLYESISHHNCSIIRVGKPGVIIDNSDQFYITDEFMEEFDKLPDIQRITTGNWFITMSAEDFEA